jgi:cystathionine beta-lyase family protein involved in aluminum resistance
MKKNIKEIEEKLSEMFKHYEDIALFNQGKVLKAFQENKVSSTHFAGTSGYGYDDKGRETLGKVFADTFGAEKGIVTPQITCGTHAITITLFGLLRPNDVMLAVSGKPYDTLDETIFGTKEGDNGSLKDFGIKYEQVDLKNNKLDYDKIKEKITALKPKMVYLQRSRGYAWRNPISIDEIKKVVEITRSISPETFVVVDNCYGEFVEKREPTEVGADIAVGSLIKNPGGGLASNGGYIVGTNRAINLIETRITSPSLKTEVGSYERGYREFYQGLFLAPHIVLQAIKGSYLLGEVMAQKGYEIMPKSNEFAYDIVKSIKFNTDKELIAFVQKIQAFSPVDSFAVPFPWDMPGYEDQVIMAAGTFVSGSSIELSCDSPIRAPYIAYFQGGLTYEHIKLIAEEINEQF